MLRLVLDWAWLSFLFAAIDLPGYFLRKLLDPRGPHYFLIAWSPAVKKFHYVWIRIYAVSKVLTYIVLLVFVSWKAFLIVWLLKYPFVIMQSLIFHGWLLQPVGSGRVAMHLAPRFSGCSSCWHW